MNAVVVFESEFGATRLIAEAIASGLEELVHTELLNVHDAEDHHPSATQLLVVGAPTHVRTMPTPASRRDGASHLSAPWRSHHLESNPLEPGVREWLDGLELPETLCAAFTTRSQLPRMLVGSAAWRILGALTGAGGTRADAPAEFLIDKSGLLLAGELFRAQAWGRALATEYAARSAPDPVR